MKFVVAVALVLTVGITQALIDGPVGVKTCPEDLPNVKACRRNALQELIPLLASGIPSIGLATADPMDDLPPIVCKGKAHGVDVSLKLDNPRMIGHSGSIIDDLQVDVANHRIHVVTHAPGAFILEGSYMLDALIMGVPLKGNGNFKSIAVDSGAEITYQGHPVTGDGGQTYLQLDSTTVKLLYGKPFYEFTGLFGDFPPLVRAANMFINMVSAPLVQREIQPALEEWMAGIYQKRAQAVFSTVPYDTLFPKTASYYSTPYYSIFALLK